MLGKLTLCHTLRQCKLSSIKIKEYQRSSLSHNKHGGYNMKVSVLNLAIPFRQLGYLSAFLVAVTFSVPALAQNSQHGVDVGKVCPNATKVGDVATCYLAVQNKDDLGDDINVVEFWDVVDPGPPPLPGDPPEFLNMRVPETGNLRFDTMNKIAHALVFRITLT